MDTFVHYRELVYHCEKNHSHDGAAGRAQDYTMFSFEFNNKQEYEVIISLLLMITKEYKHFFTAGSKRSVLVFLHEKDQLRKHRGNTGYCNISIAVSRKDVSHYTCHLVVEYNNSGGASLRACFGHTGHDLDPALLMFTPQQNFHLRTLLEGEPQGAVKSFQLVLKSVDADHSMDYIIRLLQRIIPLSHRNCPML